MNGLISLEVLTILRCPGIEKLPEGLLQQLQALKMPTNQGLPGAAEALQTRWGVF
jgi:hypothetical protein